MTETGIDKAKKHINDVFLRYKMSHEIILRGFARTIRLNLQNFPSSGHFIIEFIQNADDSGSHNFRLIASDQSILIENDGKVFTYEDVESICNSASSNKSPEYNLGYLGVGFKSCFKISDSPEIVSGDYSFKFDKKEIGNQNLPYELMPIWVDGKSSKEGAKFILPLIENDNIRHIIADQLDSDSISGKLILFLRNLEEITISADIAGKKINKIIRKIKSTKFTNDYEICETEEKKNLTESKNRWVVFRKTYDVPEDVRNDPLTIQFKRENIAKREVLIAMELDEKDEIVLGKGSIHFGVYSFLPLKDLSTTFKFIIQGDFLTNPGRSDIHREAAWNVFIAKCIYDLITKVCIPAVLKNDKWKYKAALIFHVDTSANEVINNNIIMPLENYIDNKPILFDISDNLLCAKDLIDLSKEMIDLLGDCLIKEVYGKSPLNDNVACGGKMSNLESGPDSVIQFMKSEALKKVLKRYISEKNLEWFKAFYKKLLSYEFNIEDIRELKRLPFIVDNEFNLIAPEGVRIASDKSLPESKLSEFKIVNKSFSDDELLKLFTNVLGIKKLTMEDIREVNQYTPEEWEKLPENERISYIKYLFIYRDKYSIPSTYLTLPTKDGDWAKPEELLFPAEYSPDYDIEKLISKKLLKTRVPKFVSPVLFSDDTNEKTQWKEFLVNLGCENDSLLERIEEEVGVNSVIFFEEKNGCKVEDPRNIGLNENPGYDLISTDSLGNTKLIEVKSGRVKHGFNIALSSNEHRALYASKKHNEKNYIYAVKNVLNEPEINVIEGDDIRNLTSRLLINETGRDGWSKLCRGKYPVI